MIIYLKDIGHAKDLYRELMATPPSKIRTQWNPDIRTRVIRVAYNTSNPSLWITFGVRKTARETVATFEEFLSCVRRIRSETRRGTTASLDSIRREDTVRRHLFDEVDDIPF